MGSSSMVEARLDAVQDSIDGSIGKSYHGIAARLDRIPAGKAVRVVLWLSGGICFCDSIDMNIAGPIIAQFLTTGWSDSMQNATFVSVTALGYLVGGLISGIVSDGLGRKKALIIFPSIFVAFAFVASFAPNMMFLTICRFCMGVGLGGNIPMRIWRNERIQPHRQTRSLSSLGGSDCKYGHSYSIAALYVLASSCWLARHVHLGRLSRLNRASMRYQVVPRVAALVGSAWSQR